MYLTIYVFITAICSATALFKWLEFNDRFDCVVGIAIDGKPAGVGVLVTHDTVMTSANLLQDYLTEEGKKKVSIHTINGKYDVDKVWNDVNCMIAMGGKERRSYWLDHGTDGKHCPLHDLITINLGEVWNKHEPNITLYYEAKTRMPFRVPMADGSDPIKIGKEWAFASFAFIDKQHVEESTELEVEFMDSEALENCHEWIPKDWGYFICISVDEDYVAIQTGAPLFHDGKVFGIASFSLKKMNRTIFLFTDLKAYWPHRKLCRQGV